MAKFNQYIRVIKQTFNKREIYCGLKEPNNALLEELNYASNINEVIKLKDKILNGFFIDGYDGLQSQKAVFILFKEISIISDFIFDIKTEVSTKLIFNFLEERVKFLESYTEESIKKIITDTYLQIKINPSKYADEKLSYKINTYNFQISMVLEERDFVLDELEFYNSLTFKLGSGLK